MKPIVLASASPRRKELLESIGLVFTVDPAEYEEDTRRKARPPELVKAISLEKAKRAAARHPDSIIIAADTLGVLGHKLLGKPGNADEATEMLRMMSGRPHTVLTGFTILDSGSGKAVSKVVESKVYFKKLKDEEIDDYVRSGEPLDKAGAYGIQGLGSRLVDRVEGDYYNVVGLPLYALVKELIKFGVKLPGKTKAGLPLNHPPASRWRKQPEG